MNLLCRRMPAATLADRDFFSARSQRDGIRVDQCIVEDNVSASEQAQRRAT